MELNYNSASEAVEMALNFGCGIEPLETLPPSRLLKPSEAAEYCRIDPQTLSKLHKAGAIRGHLVSERALRYRVSDLLQFLVRRTT